MNLQSLKRDDRPIGQTIPPPRARWKTRLLLPAVILVVTGGLLVYTGRGALWPAPAVRVVPVVLKSVRGTSVTATVQAAGWVEPDPYPIHVSALTDGVVAEVLVLEGQAVKAGQVVARLVDADARLALARAEAELKEREAEVAGAEAVLEAAQRDWDHPIERQRAVATAEARLAENRAELERLPAEIAAEEAKANELREDYQRKSTIAGSRAVSEMELVQAKHRLDAQEAALRAAKARGAVLQARIAQQEAELKAARENLRLRIPEARALGEARAALGKAQAALAKARTAREEAALNLERMLVRSPVEGVIMQRLTEPGAKLLFSSDSPGSAQAMRLYDPRRLQVRVDVPLADAAQVSVGQKAQIVVAVLPDRTFEGEVTRLVNEADIQKNTLQFKVSIKDPSAELRPEMLARVRFLAPEKTEQGEARQHIFAPERCIRRDGSSQAQVWVADQGGQIARLRTVTLGETHIDGWILVTGGLLPGDRIITGDASGLRDGQRIRVLGEDPMFADQSGGGDHVTD